MARNRLIIFIVLCSAISESAHGDVLRQDFPGGDYLDIIRDLPDDAVFTGNAVIQRDSYTPVQARGTFIDTDVSLSPGWLREFLFYTNGIQNQTAPYLSHVRLQIWKPLLIQNNDGFFYRIELVWEYKADDIEIGQSGILWTISFPASKSILLEEGEVLGVTFESEILIISHSSSDNFFTKRFGRVPVDENGASHDFPEVGGLYEFPPDAQGSVLSIGVVVGADPLEENEGGDNYQEEENDGDNEDEDTSDQAQPSDVPDTERSDSAEAREENLSQDFEDIIENLPSGVVYNGNPVIKRCCYLPMGGLYSWIDVEVPLSAGLLKEFFFYVHDFSSENSEGVRLQIWRPDDSFWVPGVRWQLVWEYRVTDLKPTLWRITIPESESIMLNGTERLGFTFETYFGVISFNDVNGRKTANRYLPSDPSHPGERLLPEIGNMYDFDPFGLPSEWSIGVTIETVQPSDIPETESPDSTEAVEEMLSQDFEDVIENLPSGTVFNGNPIKERANYLQTGARKSFLDIEMPLSAGLLKQFLFYVHNISSEVLPGVRLQIWKLEDLGLGLDNRPYGRWQLVWEYRVTNLRPSLWRITIPESEQIMLRGNECLGVTFESTIGIISFDYVDTHDTIFRNVNEDPRQYGDFLFPEVGNSYDFGTISLPAKFSIGVTIETERPEPGENTQRQRTVQSFPGGNFSEVIGDLLEEEVFAGNPVIPMTSYFPTGARKTFIDTDVELPAGLLKEFLFYTHDTRDFQVPEMLSLRLQIWRNVPNVNATPRKAYELLWELRLNDITVHSDTGILWKVTIPESNPIVLDGSELLGVTYESTVGIISFHYAELRQTRFRAIPAFSETGSPGFPEVGRSYEFDNIYLPAVFSMGAIIQTA